MRVLGTTADCALLVVRQDAASRVSVINSLAALDSFGVPVLGYALNVCTGRGRGQSGYGYGGYGGYSYGYGYGYGRDRGYGYGQQKEKTGVD